MLSPIKTLLKSGLSYLGYSISRIDHGKTKDRQTRKIVNAYYRGQCFKCFLGDCISDFILTGKGWDNQLEGIFDQLVSNYKETTGNVVEIGANIGASLIPIAAKYPSLTFHCVEPIPEFYELLKLNKETYRAANVNIYQQAIASIDGKILEIHIQEGTAGNLPEYDGHIPFGSMKMSAVTLDSLFGNINVSFLKIDVDGFELEVLKGATSILRRCTPLVFMEFHTKLLRRVNVNPSDIIRFFKSLGYEKISIWDNFGQFIKVTDSYEELLRLASSSIYYIDVLFEKVSD